MVLPRLELFVDNEDEEAGPTEKGSDRTQTRLQARRRVGQERPSMAGLRRLQELLLMISFPREHSITEIYKQRAFSHREMCNGLTH